MASKPPPGWTVLQPGSIYTRPLLASEASHDMIALYADGCNEPCMGISFRSSYPDQQLITAFREAIGRLRFHAPLLAANIEAEEGKQNGRAWVYRPAASTSEVLEWANETLVVHSPGPAVEDFISATNQTRLPYRHSDSHKQYFGCHLLLRENGTHSFFVHGTHSIFDAIPNLNTFYCLLKSVTHWFSELSDEDEVSVQDLAWGSEWLNLPVDPITACGGPRQNWKVELDSLRDQIGRVLNSSKLSEGLRPQRSDIQSPGLPVRIHRVIDPSTSQKLLDTLKKHSLGLTVLFEAAEALVILSRNNTLSKLDGDAHVTLDMSIIALQRFFVPPYNCRTHMSSALAFVPLVIAFRDVPWDMPKRDQLLSVMHSLKRQYGVWLASPHLAHLGAYMTPNVESNPYSAVITNLGVVERSLPLKWPLDSTSPSLEVIDLAFGHRLALCYRPTTHVWSFGNTIHLQMETSDIWDEDYLINFLDEVLKISLSVAE